jgi:hypothetical protein
MSDNLALKLLVAGIIGAVVGAAAAERYHFPTGLVYGGLNRPVSYRTGPIDPTMGSGRAEQPADNGPRIVYGVPQGWPEPGWGPAPPQPQPQGYYYRRPAPQRAEPRVPARLCYREFENWNFGTSGRYVRCAPGSAGRVYRRQREDG